MVSAELPIGNLVVLMESHMLYVMKNQLKKDQIARAVC